MTGCGHSAVPPLQRLDALHGKLARVTSLSASLASDIATINRGMRHDNRRWIRRSSLRLDQDARRLSIAVEALRGPVGDAARAERDGVVHEYLSLTLAALNAQGREAQAAARLARTVRSDPLLLSQRSYSSALWQSRLARRAARASVRSSVAARALKHAHRGKFRYVREGGGS
jgi:hypothetical protein